MSLVDKPAPPPDARRVVAMSVAAVLVAAVLIARLWYLQIALGDELLRRSEQNRTRLIRRLPPRGLITDSRGNVLATSRSRVVVRLFPEEVSKHPEVIPEVARLLEVPTDEIASTYRDGIVGRFQPVRVATDVSLEAATRIEEHRYHLPGVLIGPEPARYYPVGKAFGHLMGYVGLCSDDDLKKRAAAGYMRGDYCGKSGVEGGPFDAVLRGRDGGDLVEVDARGRVQGELMSGEPVPGATIRLSVVSQLQTLAYRMLSAYASRGHPGAAVAMDPKTGAVLALVSAPSYDPNAFAVRIKKTDWDRLRNDPRKPLINRAVANATAPGSVFKPITSIAGLETGKISRYESAYCSGMIRLGKWPKRCHKRSGHGSVSMVEAIAKSCDVYFYRLGQRLGPEVMAAWARQMGLGARSGIDLPGAESAGVVPDPAWKARRRLGPWVGGDTVDYAIGQAMLGCTPLQVCNAVCAIANGGTLYVPRLVHSAAVYDERGVQRVQPVEPKVVRRIDLQPSTRDTVIRGMLAVLEPGGTAARYAIPGLRMAGKTGTAQRRQRGEIVDDAWFVAFAPVDDPQIAVCVFVEAGGHGGTTAAPIARAMIAKYLRLEASEVTPATAED